MILFNIIVDLFRDPAESGVMKAVWMICLIFLPFLTAIIYLIVRGPGMADRQGKAYDQARQAQDEYIKSVASTASPTEQIAPGEGAARLRVDHPGRVRGDQGQGAGVTGRGFPRSAGETGLVSRYTP